MKQRNVGHSGLKVSHLGLGTMTWGLETDADDAAAQLVAFREAGGTLVDTAVSYGYGAAEQILGRATRSSSRRRRASSAPRTSGS